MTRIILINAGRFLLFFFIQVLILDNIRIGAFLIPQLYLFFILSLPFETPKWLIITSSFLLGLLVDMFMYTPGLHAAACTLIAFLRPTLIRVIASRQQFEPGIQPGITGLGFRWFLSYTLLMVSVHHVFIYMMEEFRFSGFFTTLYKVASNIAITVFFIILTRMLISKPRTRSLG